MKQLLPFLAAMIVAIWSTTALAQEATEAEEAAPTTEENGDAAFSDLGQAEGTDLTQPFIREVFGDWAHRCIRIAENTDQCQLYQLLLGPDASPIAEVSIVPILNAGEAVAGVVVIVPLETLLTEKLTVRVDGGEGRIYDFDFCNLAGCVARFGLTQSQIDAFKRGASSVMTIVPAGAPDQRIEMTASLTGFTAGYSALEAELN